SNWMARRLNGGAVQLRGAVHEHGEVGGFATDLHDTRSVLASCGDVVESAVELRHGQILAYVVTRSLDALRGFVASRLPAYQTPARYVVLDALPLDRLGQVDLSAVAPGALPEAPQGAALTPTQARVAELCAGLLQLASIDIRANFFL